MSGQSLSDWFPEDLRDAEATAADAATPRARNRARTKLLVDAASDETADGPAVAAAIRSVPPDMALVWAKIAEAWLDHPDPLSPVLAALSDRRPRTMRERAAFRQLAQRRLRALLEAWLDRADEAAADALAEEQRRLGDVYRADLEAVLPEIDGLWDRPGLRSEPPAERPWFPVFRAALAEHALVDASWLDPILERVVEADPTQLVDLLEHIRFVLGGSLEGALALVVAKTRADPTLRAALATWAGSAEAAGSRASAANGDLTALIDRALACVLGPYEAPLREVVPPSLDGEVRVGLWNARRTVPGDERVLREQVLEELRVALKQRGLLDAPRSAAALTESISTALGLGEDDLAFWGADVAAHGGLVHRSGTPPASAVRALLHEVVAASLQEGGRAAARLLADALCTLDHSITRCLQVDDWVRLVAAVAGDGFDDPAAPPPRDAVWVDLAWIRLRLHPPLVCPHSAFAPRLEAEVRACQRVGAGLDLGAAEPLWQDVDGWRGTLHESVTKGLLDSLGAPSGEHAAGNQRHFQAHAFLALSLRRWSPWCDIGHGEPVSLIKSERTCRFAIVEARQGAPREPVRCEQFEAPSARATEGAAEGAERRPSLAATQADVALRYGASPLCEPADRLLRERGGMTHAVAEDIFTYLLPLLRRRESTGETTLRSEARWGLNNWELAVLKLLQQDPPALSVFEHLEAVVMKKGDRWRAPVVSLDGLEPAVVSPDSRDPGGDGRAWSREAVVVRAREWTELLTRPEAYDQKRWIHPESAFLLLVSQWASLQEGRSGRSTKSTKRTPQTLITNEAREALDRALLAVMPDKLYGALFRDSRPIRAARVPRLKALFHTISRSGEDVEAHVALRRVFDLEWTPNEGANQERIPETLKSLLKKARRDKEDFVVPVASWAHRRSRTADSSGSGSLPSGLGAGDVAKWRDGVDRAAEAWAAEAMRAPLADQRRAGARPRPIEALIHAGMGWRQRHMTRDVRLYAAMAAARVDLTEDVDWSKTPHPPTLEERIEAAPAVPEPTLAERAAMAETLVRLVEGGLFTQWPDDARAAARHLRKHGLDTARARLVHLMRETDQGGEDRARLTRLRTLAREMHAEEATTRGWVPRGLTWLAWAAEPVVLEPQMDGDVSGATAVVRRAVDRRLAELNQDRIVSWDEVSEDARLDVSISEEVVQRMLLGADELSAAATLVLACVDAPAAEVTEAGRSHARALRTDLHSLIELTLHLTKRHYGDRDHLRRLARARLRPPSQIMGETPLPRMGPATLSAPPHEADPMRAVWRELSGLPDLEASPPRRGRPRKPREWAIGAPRFFRVGAAVHRAADGVPPLLPGGTRLGDRLWLRWDHDGGAWLLKDTLRWRVHRDQQRRRWRDGADGLRVLPLEPGDWTLMLPRADGLPPLEVRLSLGATAGDGHETSAPPTPRVSET